MEAKKIISDIRTRDLESTFIEYKDNIVFLRLKEDADFTLSSTKEQHQAQDELTQQDSYAVLVDARNHVTISKESREFMANYNNPRRKATAILTNKNAAMLIMANFYMNVNKPRIPTKLFNHESEAVQWLKEKLNQVVVK
jgi:hypothetical protein